MSVLIVHAPEDALPARALAEKLRLAKLEVALETPPGGDTRAAAQDAKVVIALWSPRALEQPALADDVAFARSGGSFVLHAAMQNAAIPQEFAGDKKVNLTGWRGEDNFPPWRALVQLVAEQAGAEAAQFSGAGPGFFRPAAAQASRPLAVDAPMARPPREEAPDLGPPLDHAATSAPPYEPPPREGGGRGMLYAVLGIAVAAVVGGGAYAVFSQTQSGGQSTAGWDDVDTTDPEALRAFIDSHSGAEHNQAVATLAELEERSFEAASDADTIDALQAFVDEFPDSEHMLAARGRIAELRTLPPGEAETAEGEAEAPPPGEEPAAPDPDLLPPGSAPVPLQPPPADDGGAPMTIAPPSTPSDDPAQGAGPN